MVNEKVNEKVFNWYYSQHNEFCYVLIDPGQNQGGSLFLQLAS